MPHIAPLIPYIYVRARNVAEGIDTHEERLPNGPVLPSAQGSSLNLMGKVSKTRPLSKMKAGKTWKQTTTIVLSMRCGAFGLCTRCRRILGCSADYPPPPLDSSLLYRCQRIRKGWCGCGNRLAEKERQNRRPFHISGRFYMGKHLKAEILLVANFLLNIR